MCAQSCPTLCDPLDSTRQVPLFFPPGKNTGAGCHFLLQGSFPTQASNLSVLHWQVDSLPRRHLWEARCTDINWSSSGLTVCVCERCTHSCLSAVSVSFGHHHKIPKTVGLTRRLLPLALESGQAKVKVLGNLGPGEGALPALETSTFWLASSPAGRDGALGPPALLPRTPTLLDQGPTLRTSFSLHHFLKGPIFNHSHIGG